jgi:hypothetical protein
MAQVVVEQCLANLRPGNHRGTVVHANESLGSFGWVALAIILLGAVVALLFGFARTFYLAILLVPVVFVVLLQLCGGRAEA